MSSRSWKSEYLLKELNLVADGKDLFFTELDAEDKKSNKKGLRQRVCASRINLMYAFEMTA